MDSDYRVSHALSCVHLTKHESLSCPVSGRHLTFTKCMYQVFLYIIKLCLWIVVLSNVGCEKCHIRTSCGVVTGVLERLFPFSLVCVPHAEFGDAS